MSQFSQENKPVKLNVDTSKKYLPEDTMFYALNHEIHLNTNGNSGTVGKATPIPANYPACDMQMPAGETYSIGSHYAVLTNESYNFVFNKSGVHFISRINGEGLCEIVNFGCLNFSADPKHAMEQWRAFLAVEKVCANRHGKQLIFTDGTEEGIYQIDVEASIETKNFTTPFFDRCAGDRCAPVKMCVPEICGCIVGTMIPLTAAEYGMTNNLLDKPFQFMVKHVYYDGRESEWSDRSTTYYQTSKGCFDTNIGLSRCIRLRIPIGNPLVDRVKIAFSDNGGLSWYVTETVEKYKKYNNAQEKWYDRGLAELLNYSDVDCSFDYIFCNDRGRVAVPADELTRVTNPIPRQAQGLINIKDALGFYNYVSGNCPIDKVQIEKMRVNVACTSQAKDCSVEYAYVTVRAIIHDFGTPLNGVIYRFGGDTDNAADDPTDPAYFGSIQIDEGIIRTGQRFSDTTRNFIAYIEGTDYWAEMEQYKSEARFTSHFKYGVVSNFKTDTRRSHLHNQQTSGTTGIFFYQECKIKVIKGTKGFIRLASHTQTIGSGEAQNTSTFVFGVLQDIRTYEGESNLNRSLYGWEEKEIYFDTCSGDFETFKAFIISDIGYLDASASFSGYIKDEDLGLPIEGLMIHPSPFHSFHRAIKTDHNGFYFFSNDMVLDGTPSTPTLDIRAERTCGDFTQIKSVEITGGPTLTEHNIIIEPDFYYGTVRSKVIDCNGAPVAGVRLSISGGKSQLTGADGFANFRIRNYHTRDRVVRVVVMNNAGCISIDCDDKCNPCMKENTKTTPACFGPTAIEVMTTPMAISTDVAVGKRGLKAGGRYPFGVIAKGDCGKQSAVYALNYVEIPKTQARGALNFCTLSYTATGMVLPDWVTCLQIVRGVNMNHYELQWVVDKIERVAGNKIKLTIQSLNDYNQRFFFQSNTVYQWLKGDRVEFVRNGDGKIFSSTAASILNYLIINPFHDEIISGQTSASADYFNQILIEDDGRLSTLTEGAIIELQRPQQVIGETIYHEICVSIPVVANALAYETGAFESFDTFIVNRTSGSFLGFFEHHSPSDFWGSHVSDAGKAHIVNRYENERRYGRSISINAPGVYNRFGDLVKTFGAPEHGDITAMNIVDAKVILAIGEHDSFLAQSADDLLRVGGDGIIRAASPDAIISDAEPKIKGAYGCQYPHIGSVFFGDGYAMWSDVNKKAYVKHNYNIAEDISEGKFQTYFRTKYQQLQKTNSTSTDFLDHYRFVTGINRTSGAVHLTIKALRHSGINNDPTPFEKPNSTLRFHPDINEFLTFVSYTPESYSYINFSDDDGCSFVSYLRGVPYIHPVISDKWNEFFGVACDWYIGMSINKFPTKVKIAQAMEVQSIPMWFAKEVKTGDVNFKSEIPPVRVKRSNTKWNAAFLRDINSSGGLYNGNEGRDYFTSVLLCRDNTNDLQYNTTNNSKRTIYSEMDLVLFKFSMSEQSGFDQNL